MKRRTVLIIYLVLAITIFGTIACTEQQRAKKFGGTATINLEANKKLINMTWKEDELWSLTRPMRMDEVAEQFEFKESSSFGIVEGKVLINERK